MVVVRDSRSFLRGRARKVGTQKVGTLGAQRVGTDRAREQLRNGNAQRGRQETAMSRKMHLPVLVRPIFGQRQRRIEREAFSGKALASISATHFRKERKGKLEETANR